jgi:ABC-type transport system involved in multi-copper enzyme maturation permease subunit
VAAFCIVASALFVPAARGAPGDMPAVPPLDPGVDLLVGVELAPLAVGILGVLLITSEYATGLIRYSMTVVPTRMPVLWAKLLVVVGVVAGIAVVSTPVALLGGVMQLRAQGWSVEPTDPELWVAASRATLYMVLVGVIGLSVGTLLRTTAASISALVGIFFGVPILVQLLPQAGARWIGRYLPAEAGDAIWAHPSGWHIASPAVAAIVFAAWAGALFAVASYRLLRQDV